MNYNKVKSIVSILEKYGNEKGVKFAIKRNKILKTCKEEITAIEQPKKDFIDTNNDFKEYLQAEYQLYTKFGGVTEEGKQVGISKENVETFMKELTELQSIDKNKAALDEYKKIDDETKVVLNTEFTQELPKFEVDELPESITGNDYDTLQELINE